MDGATIGGLVLIAAAYLLGAIPSGVVIGRLFTGVDLRAHGSGSTGTTNALRVYGWRISVAVLVMDLVVKGMGPVLAGRWLDLPWWAIAFAGVAAVTGHCWSPYIGFRGGKGMATGGGAAVAMFPWLLLIVPVMALLIWWTRYMSLASVSAAILGPAMATVFAAAGWGNWWVALATWLMAAIILFKHGGNIRRLMSGTERRIGERATANAG